MDIIAEFSDNAGLTCKLTKDRFYVSSLGNEETFALRGVNGIGIYDDLDKYNEDLELFKKLGKVKENQKLFLQVIGGFIGLMGLFILKSSFFPGFIFLMLGAFFAFSHLIIPYTNTFWWGKQNVLSEPKLESYLRVILSGGERKFLFNKSNVNSVYIADFINKLEQTLTAYN
jgi:hypothetical protein